MRALVGIGRERMYSPGKVRADHAILAAVAARLRAYHRVRLLDPDQRALARRDAFAPAARPTRASGPVVFAMCQSPRALRTLYRWEATGARIINPPTAIAACQRVPLIHALRRASVPHPVSAVINTADAAVLPEWTRETIWLKRGDVHATQGDDVVQLRGAAAARAHLARFHRRGIATAVLQRHARGQVIKFYGVTGRFFACFTAGARVTAAAIVAAIRAVTERAAVAVGLEIYGGDVVRGTDGVLMLVDLNDWPSFAACRIEAADAIAAHVLAQCDSGAM